MKLAEILNEGALTRRFIGDLSKPEQEKIARIKKGSDIKSIKVVDEWMDDHLQCVGVIINGIKIGFWWKPDDVIASFYKPTPKGNSWIAEMIRDMIKGAKEKGEWKVDEEEM